MKNKKAKFSRKRKLFKVMRHIRTNPDIFKKYTPNQLRMAAGLNPVKRGDIRYAERNE